MAPEETAPYLPSQQSLEAILPVLGYASPAALVSQEDYDALEFCEQHVKLLSRVNARYRATAWVSLGGSPSVQALENTILANHEVVCDVTNKPSQGGHVLLLIGFDRNRQVFFAKNHWGENRYIDSGWYIEDVVDSTFVQNQACWLGNWRVTLGSLTFRMILRRAEDFATSGAPTKMGTAYMSDGPHDVNGYFLDGGSHIRLFLAPGTAPVPPGTQSGTQIAARLDFSDIYNASGSAALFFDVAMSRFNTRFAAFVRCRSRATAMASTRRDGAAARTPSDRPS